MKRLNNIYETIYSRENLILADKRARKGKLSQPGVKLFDKNKEVYINQLHLSLKNKEYKTSAYTTFKIYQPKEREIFRLPYFPDRIVHHAVMIPLEKIFVSTFTADTYSCIKGKGIHAASFALRKALKDTAMTKYCLKLDIKKFYPSINHDILKSLLRKKFKDQDLLWLLDGIIDSAEGVPIGNYLSQYFANFYLTYFDHWIKEKMCVKYYFRYADDMVLLSDNKESLHQLLADIGSYLREELKLQIKSNYQIFPVKARGIDFVGYPTWEDYVLLRKRIKKSFIKMLKRNKNRASIDSYKGWIKHCNGKHLLKKLLNDKV
jgi:RNA-directed DNA polymerase